MTADLYLVTRVLLLLAVANSAPLFAKKLLADRFSAPLDGGMTLPDGQRLFGESKTFRGLIIGVGLTTLAAPLLGMDLTTGAVLAAASLAGDLLSSFVKRRLRLPTHAQAFGLDQIPEALLPLMLLQHRLGLSGADILIVVASFIVFEVVLSRLLFTLRIREQPY
jgi:CDP-2,3-bis-(O-geranylgeranyl)-sn-glycerol synthase